MTRAEAREHINGLIGSELEIAPKQSSGYDTYICPFCGNGSGESGTGICTKDGKTYKCFVCDFSGDYLDILKQKQGTGENDVFSLYGLTIDDGETRSPETITPDATPKQDVAPVDYTRYLLSAHRDLHIDNKCAIRYLERRGISEATASRFKLGYAMEWKNPSAENAPVSPRIIIPTSQGSYIARAMNTDTPKRYKVMNVGPVNIFNVEALRGNRPVFVTEGVFDALSICEVGGEAIALGGTSNVNMLLEICKKNPPTIPLFLSLDNDEAGEKAQAKLKAGLETLNVAFYEVNISGEHKDPNAHCVHDRKAFTELVNSDVVEAARQKAEAEKEAYLSTSAANQLSAFKDAIKTRTPAIPTGFRKLDEALDGGLHAGELTIIGAISSLGKTTVVLQTADQMAKGGYDVLIFSLEMSKYELMAKSISRLTLKTDRLFAKTTRDILSGKQFNADEQDLIDQSIEAYSEYSKHIYIHEGIGNIGVDQIKQAVQKHISYTGNTPVVIIDYLQIISAATDMKRATDKQIIDNNVLELKRLSRDKKLPVIAVSSFNRENYNTVVSFSSFKESGAIEYSSDVLLGLQLDGVDDLKQTDGKKSETTSKIEELKRANPRKVELKVLKNRNGKIGDSIVFSYYPAYNCFAEAADPNAIQNMGARTLDPTKKQKKG